MTVRYSTLFFSDQLVVIYIDTLQVAKVMVMAVLLSADKIGHIQKATFEKKAKNCFELVLQKNMIKMNTEALEMCLGSFLFNPYQLLLQIVFLSSFIRKTRTYPILSSFSLLSALGKSNEKLNYRPKQLSPSTQK